MKSLFILIVIFFITNSLAYSQIELPKQVVRGRIINKANQLPIEAANIIILNTDIKTVSNKKGEFILKDIKVGRHLLKISSIGYETLIYPIVVTSGKEVLLELELDEEYIKKEEIVILGEKFQKSINEASVVSSIRFNVDDTKRFAGSREDPARMAQSFAGVLGANEQRNDIIVRGGSPMEVLWRIDGLDVPNPNHFATQGATGGPVCALNINVMDNSDFLSGGFPAHYGDKISGVFDIRTRNGNEQKYEFLGQFGFNGFELGAEGPIMNNKSSFLINYRYSFLELLDKLGVDLGFSGIPEYQDLNFKTNFKIDDYNDISLTGLWGNSNINILFSKTDEAGTGDMDIVNGTDLYALIFNWKSIFNEKIFGILTIGTTSTLYRTKLDSLTFDNDYKLISNDLWLESHSTEAHSDIKYVLNYSMDRKNYLSFGTTVRLRNYDLYERRTTYDWETGKLHKIDENGSALQLFGYVNWKHKLNQKTNINLGLFSQYFELNKKQTIEPRIGLEYNLRDNQTLSMSFSLHSQTMSLVLLFDNQFNRNLDYMKAIHYIVGYTYYFNYFTFAKIEAYYKDIFDVPVEKTSSRFSVLNSGANFGKVFAGEELVNKGFGKSYGIELTLMKSFESGYYYTFTGSLFRQKYKASDGVWRAGAFDNRYIFNLLGGYEWKISPKFTIEISGKYTFAGGAPYIDVDINKSKIINNTVFDYNTAFDKRNENYSRFDLKIEFRENYDKFAMVSYTSIDNLFNSRNILYRVWSAKDQKVKKIYQMGTVLLGGFRIEF